MFFVSLDIENLQKTLQSRNINFLIFLFGKVLLVKKSLIIHHLHRHCSTAYLDDLEWGL